MAELGIPTQSVQDCELNRRDEYLDAEIQGRHVTGIFSIPTLIINNSPFRGNLICSNPINAFTCGPLEAICSGYASGTAPDACTGSISCAFGVVQDECGVCGSNGEIDPCGLCLSPDSSHFGESCLGCDGVPLSGKVADACGVCEGDGSFDAAGRCWPAGSDHRCDAACAADPSNPNSPLYETVNSDNTLLWVIFGGSLVVIGFGVWAWNKRQQAHLARIDAVLQSYLPLQEANGLRTGGPNGGDNLGHHIALTSLEDEASDMNQL